MMMMGEENLSLKLIITCFHGLASFPLLLIRITFFASYKTAKYLVCLSTASHSRKMRCQYCTLGGSLKLDKTA